MRRSRQNLRSRPQLAAIRGRRTYVYHADGQLASATVGSALRADRGATPLSETFLWDGLALIQRGDEQFVNEPHVGGGNPVASSKGTSYFNDALGTTVGSKSNGKYTAAALTAFGENYLTTQPPNHQTFYTGKPYVEGLGHAFLMRNYRAGLAKWQTADPMGYPDGWNQLAYCGNGVVSEIDYCGCFPIDYIVESVFKAKLDEFCNKKSIENLLRIFYKSVPADNIHVYGYVLLQVTNIEIYYDHYFSGSCMTHPQNYTYQEPIDITLERTQPDVYCIRNEPGDRDGSSWKIGNGTPIHLDVPGLSYTDSFLSYEVTVTRIVCDYNLVSDGHVRYINYIKE